MSFLPRVLFRGFALLLGFFPALAASEKPWVEVRSPHFIAYSDAGEAEARRTLEAFEGIRSVFTVALPALRVDLHKPVVVVATEHEDSMRRFLPQGFEGKDPKRPGGTYFQGRDRDFALLRLDLDHQINQPFAVVFHEYTHAVIHNNFPALPTWLDEGIADFYGSTEIRSKRVYLGRVPHRHLATVRQSRMPLADLFRVTHDSPVYQEGSKANVFYAQSWSLVHMLFLDDEARKAGLLGAYLRALGTQAGPLAAAQAGFGDMKDLESRLARYVARPAFTFLDLDLKVDLADKDFTVRPVPEAEALVLRAEVLTRARRDEDAARALAQARALAPASAPVQAAVGLAAAEKGDAETAAPALGAALAAGSQDFRVPLRLADLALGHRLQPVPPSEQVLAWLEAARRLAPDFPDLHFALCRFHARDPRSADQAVAAGQTALRLAPADVLLRLNVGGVFLSLGREADARALGEEAARLASADWERQAAASYQAHLRRYLDERRAQAQAVAAAVPATPQAPNPGTPEPGKAPAKGKPLRIWLPDTLADLHARIQVAVAEGRLDEAIQMVKDALPTARGPYEQSSLKAVLTHLKARKAGR